MSKETVPPSDQVNIEDEIKRILLMNAPVSEWIEMLGANLSLKLTGKYPQKQLPEELLFRKYYPFTDKTPEEIMEMGPEEFRNLLSMMETEDQDSLVRRLPSELVSEEEFWKFIYPKNYLEDDIR